MSIKFSTSTISLESGVGAIPDIVAGDFGDSFVRSLRSF